MLPIVSKILVGVVRSTNPLRSRTQHAVSGCLPASRIGFSAPGCASAMFFISAEILTACCPCSGPSRGKVH